MSNLSIVFIAQLGNSGSDWQQVVDLLPEHKTFVYDRPGTGSAPPRPAPNPPIPHSVFARELAHLLDDNVAGPLVVVGHSFGGLIARAFAGLYPDRVAGMVFVDASIPQFYLAPSSERKFDGDGPDATEIDVVTGQVEILSAELPDVPAVVITRTPGRWAAGYPLPHPAVEDLWLVSQRLLARQLDCPLIVADDCDHQMPRKAPVAHAVRATAEAAHARERVRLDPLRLAAAGAHLDDQA